LNICVKLETFPYRTTHFAGPAAHFIFINSYRPINSQNQYTGLTGGCWLALISVFAHH